MENVVITKEQLKSLIKIVQMEQSGIVQRHIIREAKKINLIPLYALLQDQPQLEQNQEQPTSKLEQNQEQPTFNPKRKKKNV